MPRRGFILPARGTEAAMRLVITGATGNIGTALLRLLQEHDEVTSLGAVATRPPPPQPPYDRAEWLACDLADRSCIPSLTELMRHATAVVNLAWDILGAHHRRGQRRTNLLGTSHVIDAATRARVGQLVHLSSVAAYAPDPEHAAEVPEEWPTEGIPGNWYSADKVAAERMLDQLVHTGAIPRVVRVRPPMVLQPDAAGELTRYLLGRLAPLVRHRATRVPVLPLPGSVKTQVVHAEDVATLVWLAIQAGATGPYNVADPPVLSADDFARALHLRRIPIPAWLLRTGMELTAATRLQPLDSSWFDLLANVPLVSTHRAERELGWRPHHRGDTLLAAVRDAAVRGAGTASERMAPQPA